MRVALLIFVLGLLIFGIAVSQDAGSGKSQQIKPLFAASEQCMTCHDGLTTNGIDISIGKNWRPTMMANSARDPYWLASVRRESLDHSKAGAAIENECALCHMPMAASEQKAAGREIGVFATIAAGKASPATAKLAIDGVSCLTCHQISDAGLGTKASFSGNFGLDLTTSIGQRKAFGVYESEKNAAAIMQATSGFAPQQASHIAGSELCATCHTLYTHALDEQGNAIGEFPEQVPYLEWKHSALSKSRSCMTCHMPKITNAPIASMLGQPRDYLMQHVFRAGNFLMPQIIARNQAPLAVSAPEKELLSVSEETVKHLETYAARLNVIDAQISGEMLTTAISVKNLAGHKLPTSYPSRRVWVHFIVKTAQGETIFESGALKPDGSIAGNDNDADAARFEPHYREIDSPEKVQIYESIIGDAEGRVTTGLLKGVRYIKDNRVLPMGFDKTNAEQDIAVQGNAFEDEDFSAGGDKITFSVKVKPDAGPYSIQAELCYQPIGYRWAQNLRQRQSAETDRFVALYNSLSSTSAVILARASATAQSGSNNK